MNVKIPKFSVGSSIQLILKENKMIQTLNLILTEPVSYRIHFTLLNEALNV